MREFLLDGAGDANCAMSCWDQNETGLRTSSLFSAGLFTLRSAATSEAARRHDMSSEGGRNVSSVILVQQITIRSKSPAMEGRAAGLGGSGGKLMSH